MTEITKHSSGKRKMERGESDLTERIALLENELRTVTAANEAMLQQLIKMDEANHAFKDQYLSVEDQNSDLIKMYVAMHRLHSTLDFNNVVSIVKEIVINMVGAEKFSLFYMEPSDNRLELIADEELDGTEATAFEIIDLTVARVTSIIKDKAEQSSGADGPEPIACIPLIFQEMHIGFIVIYKLLAQKSSFRSLDQELFDMLCSQAGNALYSSKLVQTVKAMDGTAVVERT